jgi:hypothetical protein
MDTNKLIEDLEKTASELEAIADAPVKQASSTENHYTTFLDGMVKQLGIE